MRSNRFQRRPWILRQTHQSRLQLYWTMPYLVLNRTRKTRTWWPKLRGPSKRAKEVPEGLKTSISSQTPVKRPRNWRGRSAKPRRMDFHPRRPNSCVTDWPPSRFVSNSVHFICSWRTKSRRKNWGCANYSNCSQNTWIRTAWRGFRVSSRCRGTQNARASPVCYMVIV